MIKQQSTLNYRKRNDTRKTRIFLIKIERFNRCYNVLKV